ncbi:MAG: hypothetical protein V4850_02970 [Myxococcota bacterium]
MAPSLEWQTVYDRFQVDVPAKDPAWRVLRPDIRLDRVRRALATPFARKKCLLLGTQGSGKTTELYALLEDLPANRVGVYFDVAEHVRNKVGDERVMDRMAAWEVVFLTGLAVWKAARALGFATDEDGAAIAKAAAPLLAVPGEKPPQVDYAKLAAAMSVGLAAAAGSIASLPGLATAGATTGALTVLGSMVGAGEWKLPIGQRGPPAPDADQHARRLLDAVNTLFRRVETQQWRFLVVIDGLDRLRDGGAIQRLFLESTLLGQLDTFTVATGPVALSRQARLGQLSGWEPTVLPELTVFNPNDPSVPAGQLGFFSELWARRTGDLHVSIAPAGLERLAWASGGRLREFVRLVQNIAMDAYGQKEQEASLALVDDLVAHERQTFSTGFHRGYDDVLRRVRDDPEHQLPDVEPRADGSNLVDELLARYWLLPYRNGKEWFHPHPLLLDRLSRPSPAA